MAIAKPSPQEVIDITATDFSSAVVATIIDDAALIAEDCIKGYSEERQKAIVKWLAAHLIVSTNGASGQGSGSITSEKLGDASISYGKSALSGEGLAGTHYGQQALLLDPNGCLATLGEKSVIMKLL